MKEAIIKILIFLLLSFIIFIVIAYARGYRFNFKDQEISSTGILAISSSPKAAKVFINGHLKGVTDMNITLHPGNYTIEINKDGYMPFKKNLTLKGEIVETIDPILFPTNPSLSPLSNLGIVNAFRVDQTDNIILISENDSETDGVYLFDASSKPITIFAPLKTLLLKSKLPKGSSLADSDIAFSHDFKQAILDVPNGNITNSYSISLNSENPDPFDVTNSKTTLIEAWEQEKNKEIDKILETFPSDVQKTASSSFNIISFSPDQTKILYKATSEKNIPLIIKPPLIASNQSTEARNLKTGSLYVYDKREDKNYLVGNKDLDINDLIWYSDSKRLVYKEDDRISVSSYDATNKETVYSGPFENKFFSVNSDGRLIVLANLNPKSNKLPDLYLVGIR
ncbi:MAG: PEGA domain-containing protein [bacterium]